MYLDKLYTKLYSEGNLDGLQVLMDEIKVFSNDLSKDARKNLRKGNKELFKTPKKQSNIDPRMKKDQLFKSQKPKDKCNPNDLKSSCK